VEIKSYNDFNFIVRCLKKSIIKDALFHRHRSRYLAKTTSLDQLIPITYIVFLTEMQKGKPLKNDLPY